MFMSNTITLASQEDSKKNIIKALPEREHEVVKNIITHPVHRGKPHVIKFAEVFYAIIGAPALSVEDKYKLLILLLDQLRNRANIGKKSRQSRLKEACTEIIKKLFTNNEYCTALHYTEENNPDLKPKDSMLVKAYKFFSKEKNVAVVDEKSAAAIEGDLKDKPLFDVTSATYRPLSKPHEIQAVIDQLIISFKPTVAKQPELLAQFGLSEYSIDIPTFDKPGPRW
jgi:hypothetical protein